MIGTKYQVGDIIHDKRFDEYYLIVDIGTDDLFGARSYLLSRINGSGYKKNIQAYYEVRGVDRSNEYTLVA